MEFIGLLGLLGLIGFFFGRGLESKFDSLKKEVRRKNEDTNVETRIAENEKFISEVQREIEQINSALQNFATVNELNKTSQQIQIPLQEMERKISAAVSKVNELENKFSAQSQNFSAEDLKNIQNSLKNFQTKIEELQNANKKIDVRLKSVENLKISPPSVPNDSEKIFGQKISALETKISEQNSILSQYQNYFAQLQNNLNNLQKKIDEQQNNSKIKFDELSKITSNLEGRIKKLESDSVVTPPPPVIPPPPFIYKFQIKNLKMPLFTNNPRDAAKSISVIENLSGLTSFLENSNFDKKETFIRLIKNYQQHLKKFIDKVQRGKFDEDTFSEEVTDAFFDTLSKYFLATLPVSIYRGSKEDPKFYSEFLVQVNSYLSACHVYTELIEPKKLMKHDDVEKMGIVKKDTAIKNDDKIIDEVERLPYFLDYLTEDNESERYCYEGKMVVFKFDEGKK
ncbi:MAG: hypothetical protein IK062_03085 [Selenomonadaceae bacterium]|nr:hypothetical protein [Selenomonadaceae bacterium]